ncbi:hypothetical protein C5167_006020 [Papaver somniferum]|uniref:Major facilitator superfamily (MFS) profile domain-containing protein n=1 Tax=Papaver somniferum TaxID=3469 RepID=A0A4Y7JD29_PAPSO|nr:hypothetical protein C5167_006020 [Papaver somniferum]
MEEEKAAISNETEIRHRGIKAMPFIIGNEMFEKLGNLGNIIQPCSLFHHSLQHQASTISKLHPPTCGTKESLCVQPTASQWAFLLVALLLLVIGSGGIRPCNMAFGADQFNPKTDSGKKSIDSFMNCFINKAAILTNEDQINEDGSPANPWRLCTMQKVEEVKCLVRVLLIWVSSAILHIATTQQQTYVVYQALQSDRRLGNNNFKILGASYTAVSWLTIVVWIPIYDRLIVPSLRKFGGITLLQRIGIGTFLSALFMLVSALAEERRRNLDQTHPTLGYAKGGGAVSSMPGLWLIPQLILSGLAEAFGLISQVEFYYKQFPENMRSIGVSVYYLAIGVGSYASGFLVSVVHQTTEGAATGNWLAEDLNKGRLDYFYYTISLIEIVNFVYFLVCAKWYRYKAMVQTLESNHP